MTNEKVASRIVLRIEQDLLDRSGVGNELEMLDDAIREEIRATWEQIVLGELERLSP